MAVIIADTSPLNYLIILRAIEVLPHLYGTVFIPESVLEELRHSGAPDVVRRWAGDPPDWIQVKSAVADLSLRSVLGRGEADAITLASELGAHLLLDDRAARRIAIEKHLTVTGTVGILERAAELGMIDLQTTLDLLVQTNFRISRSALVDALKRIDSKKNRS